MELNDVFPKVKEILADVLAIDEDDIKLTSSLIDDLDAESIDFLDLVFRLEREFKVKIPRGQIEKEVRGNLSDEEFEKNGVVTDAGLAALRSYLTEVPADRIKTGLKVNNIPRLFTVETFCKVVLKAQAQ
ncbi:MAG: acyl carrier protein [Legionellales bacterium]|nr:acyl carrier protein [Legionellales bacterium]